MSEQCDNACDNASEAQCESHACADATIQDSTEQYGTEHHQASCGKSHVLDTRTPVDKCYSPPGWRLPQRRLPLADEWFDDFVQQTERLCRRIKFRMKLQRELQHFLPSGELEARVYQEKTEQLTRFLRGQQHLPHWAALTERKVS